jgi:hypothetical protein
MECLFGQIEVAEQPNERGQDAARLGPIDRLDLGSDPVGRLLADPRLGVVDQLISQIGRTSTLPVRADGIFDAVWMASLRSRASSR